MAYYIVFQNKTYKEEQKGGFLWAPKKNKSGKDVYHWTNMTKVKKDDIIFSLYKRNIVSVNIAKEGCIESNRPTDLDSINLWEKEGWRVNVEYNVLDYKVSIDDNIEEILKLCTEKYSPFTKQGKGNQGYLFEISNNLGEYLIDLVKLNNDIKITKLSEIEKEYINDTNDILNKFKDETEKHRLVKTRVGQGLFKDKLLSISCECAICGLTIKELLIASHSKPWKVCSDEERLDVNNGLLLCPTHDALFDKGLITFNNGGDIIISTRINGDQLNLVNISKDTKIKLNEDQVKFIKYHRENVFK